jgi:hypothetical protein
MKYLKSWTIFENEEIGTDDVKEVSPDQELEKETQDVRKDSLEKINKDLSEYKQKRQVLDDLFKKDIDDSSLSQEIQSKVYKNKPQDQGRNVFLKGYENVMRMIRRVNKLNKSLKKDELKRKDVQNTISDLQSDIQDASDEQDVVNLTNQIKKYKEYLKKIVTNINNNKKQLNLNQTNYLKRKTDFDTEMKEEQKRIENISKGI